MKSQVTRIRNSRTAGEGRRRPGDTERLWKNFETFISVFLTLEIKVVLVELQKRQLMLQKQLEDEDYVQAQLSKDQPDPPLGFTAAFERHICSVVSPEDHQRHEGAEGAGGRGAAGSQPHRQ